MKKVIKVILKLCIVVVIGYLMFLPIVRFNNYLFTKEVEIIQKTITEQREVAESVELTALVDTIVETNKEIAKLKSYERIGILKPYFCKDFKDIKFIR